MYERIVVFNNGIVTEEGMSGSDNRAVNWSRIWSDRCPVTLILPAGGAKRYADHKADKIFTTQKNFLSHSAVKLLIEYVFRTFRAVRRTRWRFESPHLIYSSSDLMPDSIPALLLKRRNRKNARLIMGCHLLAPNPFKGYRGLFRAPSLKNLYYFFSQSLILKWARKHADKILVSNELDKRRLVDGKSFTEDRVKVVYGGLDFSAIDPVVECPKKFDAVFVGRNHPQKGIEDLILAWKRVCSQKNDASLVILGETESFRDVREKFANLGLAENVHFGGFLSAREKYETVKAAKLLVFPSHYESFGMVALEALACGVPVIAYNLEIYKDIYGDKLVTVPKGDTASLGQAILDTLDRYRDKDHVRSLIGFSRQFDFHTSAQAIYTCVSV